MTNIDQFESVFKAADKPQFAPEAVRFASMLVVTTLETEQARSFEQHASGFLAGTGSSPSLETRLVTNDDFTEVSQLLQLVEETQPDLICTYRNLKRPARDYPYSLGVFVDVLTQATKVPVLLLPTMETIAEHECRLESRSRVMAITDHLTGDHHLVSFAAQVTQADGTLWLAHLEDLVTFERYMETISKIPSIDTDSARQALLEQLLQEPHDYIKSCKEVLASSADRIVVEEIIQLGHRLTDYKRLVEQHEIDLVVMNTKDEDQLAMHGVAYPLTVELRQTPLLLV